MNKLSLSVLCALLLSGCSEYKIADSRNASVLKGVGEPISIDRALDHFDAICLKTDVNLSSALEAVKRAGAQPDDAPPWVTLPPYNAHVWLRQGERSGTFLKKPDSCVLSFETRDPYLDFRDKAQARYWHKPHGTQSDLRKHPDGEIKVFWDESFGDGAGRVFHRIYAVAPK